MSAVLAGGAILASTSVASAQQALQNVRLFSNGSCGETTPTDFLVQIISVPTQFTTVDEVIDFGGGVTQPQDVLVFYTTDAANVIVGRSAQAFPTQADLANDLFFSVQQRPTVAGNFTVRAADETDRTPDRALGSTFSGGVLTQGFNAVALDADCVPLSIDTTAPEAVSLLRRTGADFATNADTLVWDLVFDEDVQGVGANDFTVSGTTATVGVTGSGSTYAVTLSGGDLAGLNGLVALDLRPTGSSIQDLAGNAYAGGTPAQIQRLYAVDNSSDTVEITSASSQVAGTFEVVTNFQEVGPAQATNGSTNVRTQFIITNGTLSGGSSFGGSTLRFNVEPTAPGPVTVRLPAGTAFDVAGNPNLASNTLSVDFDPPNQAPSADAGPNQSVQSGTQVALAGGGTDSDGSIASYSWARTGGTGTAGNASLSNASAQNPTFTDNSLTSNDGPVTHIFSLVVTDDDGAMSTASSVTITITPPPNAAPAATAGAGATTVASGDQVQLTGTGTDSDGTIAAYSWARTGGTGIAGNASLSNAGAQNPTFTDNSLSIGDASVTHIFSLVVTDDDGATSPAASVTITITAPLDEDAPVIAPPAPITVEAGPSGTASVSFSAVVNDNFDTIVQPVFTLAGDTITSPFDFSVGVNNVLVNAQDAAGNDATQQTLVVTVTGGIAPNAPTISTSDINGNRSLTIGGSAEADTIVRVTFPDATFQEVTATGGIYEVTSAADMAGGTVSVTATDAAGNQSSASTVELFPDYERPTVEITGAPTRIVDETPFAISITFSEAVTGFEQSDLSVSGANITAFSGSGATYSAEITPVAGEPVSISIAAGVAEDAFTNLNDASNAVEIANAALTETEEFIADAAQARNRALMATQPRLRDFMTSGVGGSFNLQATQGAGNFGFTTSSERPVWAAGQGRWATAGELESSYVNLAVGAHYSITPNVLVGAMAQFDSFSAEELDGSYDGTGWMVGPYAVGRLADQPLVFSASYLVGQAENEASPDGTFEDKFTSDRSILTLGASGELAYGRITLIPAFDLRHATDENESYVDGDGFNVRSTRVTTSEATIGLDLKMPISVENGALELLGGFGLTSAKSDNSVISESTTRGDFDLELRYNLDSGARITATASYDGLGQDDYESIGAGLLLEVAF